MKFGYIIEKVNWFILFLGVERKNIPFKLDFRPEKWLLSDMLRKNVLTSRRLGLLAKLNIIAEG